MSDKPAGKITLSALGAARISEQLWAYMVSEGGDSDLRMTWPGWHRYGAMRSYCALCEYTYQGVGSDKAAISPASCMERCPYVLRYGYTCTQFPSSYRSWVNADDPAIQLTHAKAFLTQLTMLRQYLEAQEFQSRPQMVVEKPKDGWEKVMYPHIPAGEGAEYRARVEHGKVVVEARMAPRPTPKNITSECSVELVKSQHSGGWYVLIKHGDKQLFALGLDDKSAHLQLRGSKGYRVTKAKNATVSFNIMK